MITNSHGGLQDDIGEIIALIPLGKLRADIKKFFNGKQAVNFLQQDLMTIAGKITNDPICQDAISFLEEAGIDVPAASVYIENLISDLTPGTAELTNVEPFVVNAIDSIPIEKIINLIKSKKKSSPEFKAMYNKIASEEGREHFFGVLEIPLVMIGTQLLKDRNVDVDALIQKVCGLFEWHN